MLLQELPDCAMCHWCLALAHGPNPNKVADHQQQGYPTFGPEEADAAGREARRALGLASEQLGAAQSNASQVGRLAPLSYERSMVQGVPVCIVAATDDMQQCWCPLMPR